MKEKFYITTPIYYPSAEFHIGHCYTTIIADAIARFKRLDNFDVFFQTGTDEHGLKIENKAKANNVTPKEYVDKIIENAKDLWENLQISYDYFIRTTDEDHKKRVQEIFTKLYESGDIYKGEYKGLYCIPCESFWTKTQLVDGKCPDCGRDVEEITEEAYFFKLTKYQKPLEKLYEENPDFLQPASRRNEMLNNFLKPGLEDLCVSRTSFKWGIPVPFDEKHVIYVWIDALSNYITSLGYPDNLEKFEKYWPADVHLVGKEIVRFHAIIWPAILIALGIPLPKKIFGHGWLVIESGQKIGKSYGNYKDPREYIKAYGVDAVRYFALREIAFGNDGNFSEEALINHANSDLANILGNLVNRTVSMSKKYFASKVTNKNQKEDIDDNLIKTANNLYNTVREKMDNLYVSEAIEEIFNLLKQCNKYIDETMPWSLAKDETQKDRLETVLYNLLECIRICATLLQPFIPNISNKILDELNIKNHEFKDIKEFNETLEYSLNEPEIIFERIEVE